MMNEFVREAYIAARESDTGVVSPHYGDEYDTWLRALKEDPWDEGYVAGFTDGDAGGRWADDDNPYRADRIEQGGES